MMMVLFSFVFMPNILMNSLRLFQSLFCSSQRSSMLRKNLNPCATKGIWSIADHFSLFGSRWASWRTKLVCRFLSSFWVLLSLSLPNILAKVGTRAFDTLHIKTSNELSHANPCLIRIKVWTLYKQRVFHEAFPGMRPLMQSSQEGCKPTLSPNKTGSR